MNFTPHKSIKNALENIKISDFELIFKELYPELCRYCIQLVRKEYIAEDIVQDLFIYLWENRFKIKIHTSIKSFLYKAVKNRSIDYLRSRFAKLEFEREEVVFNLPGNSSAESKIVDEEILTIARKALNILPEKCYTIFSLSTFGGLSSKEIAGLLKISVKTVQNQIIFANKKINDFLNKYWFTTSLLVLSGLITVS